MKLTWNQRRAMDRLADIAFEATARQVAEVPRPFQHYLCGSAARSALMSLQRKGLVDCIPTSPFRYRLTDAGRAALTSVEENRGDKE